MSVPKTLATARRVLNQLHHDRRTLALILVVPCLLLFILKYLFQGEPRQFNQVAPLMLGIFPLLMMFLVTSIATLRERTNGTLDRLLTMPLSKLDFIFGYALAFSALAFVQACVVCFVALGLLDVTVMGDPLAVLVSAVLAGFLGTALGLLVSAFATSEFQAVQLVMPIMMPQILLCGLFVPREHMAQLLQWLSDIFPLTYSVDAMREVTLHAGWTDMYLQDVATVVGCGILALALGSMTIRRQA